MSKSLEEKAEQWLNDNIFAWTDTQLKCLTILLKEQDRDTRHACAEATLSIDWWEDAHDVVMNCRGGIVK